MYVCTNDVHDCIYVSSKIANDSIRSSTNCTHDSSAHVYILLSTNGNDN